MASVERVYPSSINNSTYQAVAITSFYAIGSSSSVNTKNPKTSDIIRIFEKDVEENISELYGESQGTIVLKITDGYSVHRYGVAYLHGFFLFVPKILGIPYELGRTYLNLTLDVLDNKGGLIGRYKGDGYYRCYGAFYWGYNEPDRKASLEAFKIALNKAKASMFADTKKLENGLNSAKNP